MIAQTPIEPRDHSRLLILNREDCSIKHRTFFELVEYLHAGDVLVINESRVIPARLIGKKAVSGGKIEVLLLQRLSDGLWYALVRPGKSVGIGTTLEFRESEFILKAEVTQVKDSGMRVLKFSEDTIIPVFGKVALPPYIHTPLGNPERYQTVYAKNNGSVAAPTAGLHFTPELLQKIKEQGVIISPVTLHVGLDTFQPVREEDPEKHIIHQEYGIISAETALQINKAKAEKRRVICVGTTAVRIVEHVAKLNMPLKTFNGWIDLFIIPGYQFHIVDMMITNFHLPKTTLIMLVSSFAGKDLIFQAYTEAIKRKYRFYSFGDAMLIL